MSSKRIWMTSLMLLAFVLISVGTTAAGTSLTFGISGSMTKIDNSGDITGDGRHNLIVNGSSLYAAYAVNNAAANVTLIYVGKSYDGGSTWNASELVTYGSGMGDAPSVAVAALNGTTYVYVAWNQNGDIYYSRAEDTGHDGWNWSAPVAVMTNANYQNIAADGSGLVHITAISGSQILYARSTDAGQSFTQEYVPGASSPEGATIAIDSTGDLFVTWKVYASPPAGTSVYFSKRTSSAWTDPVAVSGNYGSDVAPSITALDANHISIAWIYNPGALAGGSSNIYISSSTNGGSTWTPQRVFSTPTMASLGGPSIAVTSTGGVSIAYYDWNSNIVSYLYKTSSGAWTSQTIFSSAENPSLAFDGSDKANIVFDKGALYFTKQQ